MKRCTFSATVYKICTMDLILIDFKSLFFLCMSEEELWWNSYSSIVSSDLPISSKWMSFSKWGFDILKSSAKNETIVPGMLVLCHEFSSSSESQNFSARLKFIFSRVWQIFIAASFMGSCDRSIHQALMKRQIVIDSYDESHKTELILLNCQQDTA